MRINKFREFSIFDNLMVNQICDEMASALAISEEYPSNFVLTGAAAYALQRELVRPLENIIFRVMNQNDYFILLEYLDRISTHELMKYGNRTYFKFPAGAIEVYFMIMFDQFYESVSLDYNGIKIESVDYIKPELL